MSSCSEKGQPYIDNDVRYYISRSVLPCIISLLCILMTSALLWPGSCTRIKANHGKGWYSPMSGKYSYQETCKFVYFFQAILLMAFLSAGSHALAFTPASSGSRLFHKGGTGDCDGCHLMQGSSAIRTDTEDPANVTLDLRGSDPSSTCLRCHQAPAGGGLQKEHYIATSSADLGAGAPPRQMTPGGDFGWLKKNYRWSGSGEQGGSRGERHGHNITAMDYNYSADSTISVSPGGSYPASSLSCISCHDPHGNYRRFADGTTGTSGVPIIASGSYKSSPDPDAGSAVGSYRLLAGKEYQSKHFPGGTPFTADPPAAVAPDNYNRGEAVTDTRVAYGSGMSEWCANCHAAIHNGNYPNVSRHPSGNSARLSMEITVNYYSYISSGNMSGNANNSYTSLVPFEMGSKDYRELKAASNSDGSDRNGPSGNANVMCLSCHRAHASGSDSMTRFNVQADFMVYNGRYPGINNGAPAELAQGRTEAEAQKTLYDRPANLFASYQRSLCNKCHAKD
jgi:hypothetical protein